MQDIPRESNIPRELVLVNQIGGDTRALDIDGDFLYVGVGLRVVVYCVTNPRRPVIVGQSPPLDYVVDRITVAHHRASVETELSIYILDVTTPHNPIVCAKIEKLLEFVTAHVANGFLYLVNNWEFTIYGLANASDPVVMGRFPIGRRLPGRPRLGQRKQYSAIFSGFSVEGPYAYAATNAGLAIFDVTNPGAPVLVGSCTSPDDGTSIAVRDTLALLGTESSLQVIDVSDPANPMLAGFVGTSGSIYDLAFGENRSCILATSSGLYFVDLTDPGRPRMLSHYSGCSLPSAVAVRGEVAFVGLSHSPRWCDAWIEVRHGVADDRPPIARYWRVVPVSRIGVIARMRWHHDRSRGSDNVHERVYHRDRTTADPAQGTE